MRNAKSIWECHITIHYSIKEKMNSVLLNIAREEKTAKSRVVQDLLETHPKYLKVKKEMEKEGYFI